MNKTFVFLLVLLINLFILTNSKVTILQKKKCPRGQALLGGICKVCSDEKSPVGDYFQFNDDFCIHRLPKSSLNYTTNKQENTENTCLGDDVLSMFFSWVSYSDDYDILLHKWFSGEDGYPRIKGCGRWLQTNAFHNRQSIYITSHASFFINVERKKVILAFRGTNFDFTNSRTWIDWFGNLYLILRECPFVKCGKVHTGFKRTYSILEAELYRQVSEYLDKGYDMIVTGHSQGASVSQIAAVHFNELFKNHNRRIKNYAFAAPRTGNKDFAFIYDRLPNIGVRYSAVNGAQRDLVTSIPLETMFYKHTRQEVIVPCDPKNFGNPNPPKDIRIAGLFPRNVPSFLGCHYHQSYLDGIIEMKKKLLAEGKTTEEVQKPLVNSQDDSVVSTETVDSLFKEILAGRL